MTDYQRRYLARVDTKEIRSDDSYGIVIEEIDHSPHTAHQLRTFTLERGGSLEELAKIHSSNKNYGIVERFEGVGRIYLSDEMILILVSPPTLKEFERYAREVRKQIVK